VGKYCAPVWCRSAHTGLVDAQLNSTMHLISGTLRSTALPWLPVLANIESPALQRKAATDRLVAKARAHESWPLHHDISNPPPFRLTSRKPLWHESEPVDINSQWRDSWKSASVVNAHLVSTPQSDNRALLFLDNNGLSWTVFAPDKVTAVPVRINGNFQTPISVPAVRPKRCHTLSNPAHRQDYGGLSKLHSADDDAVAWLTSYGSWCIWQQQQLCCTRTANITQSSSNNLHSYVRSQSSLLRHFVFYAVLAGSLECFGFGLGFCVNVKTCCS